LNVRLKHFERLHFLMYRAGLEKLDRCISEEIAL
jgi:hypothetical protein